jgi:hypothetical protein
MKNEKVRKALKTAMAFILLMGISYKAKR